MRTLTISDQALLGISRKFLFVDDFVRADAATLGGPWTIRNGTFGITSNTGYYSGSTTAAVAIATVDVGSANQIIEWDMSAWSKGPVYSIFRYVDTNNYWFLAGTNSASGTVYLFKRIAGTETLVATQTGATWGAGYRLRVEASGSSIVVKVAGSALSSLTTTSSDLATTGVHAGIGGYAGNGTPPLLNAARWSRFMAEAA